MSNSLNLDLLKKSSVLNRDVLVAKNIIEIIFRKSETDIKNDVEMSGIVKGFVLKQLPKVINDSKNRIDKMSPSSVKMLLDSIQYELNKR